MHWQADCRTGLRQSTHVPASGAFPNAVLLEQMLMLLHNLWEQQQDHQ